MAINTTPALPNAQKKLGADNVGYFVMPDVRHGLDGGDPDPDTQGFGIPAKANDQDVAAKFLEFMHSPERVHAMWTLSQQIPANTNFDASVDRRPAPQGRSTRSGSRATTTPTSPT